MCCQLTFVLCTYATSKVIYYCILFSAHGCNCEFSSKYEVRIKDFGKSWKDGVAFNAMIHNLRPDLVDMEIVQQQQPRVNLEHAFSTAETHLGIARLLDPEGTSCLNTNMVF